MADISSLYDAEIILTTSHNPRLARFFCQKSGKIPKIEK
jgi:hypothetical protein